MKKNVFCIVAVIIATIASVTVVSCKKEKEELAAKAPNSEAQALLKRIHDFQALRDAVNSGAKADGKMTVEEMRETLCLVSNYEHSEHELYCQNTVLDTVKVRMVPVDMDGNVSESDVVAVYNAFEMELENILESIDDDMNVPSLFSIVLPNTGTRDEEDINIIFTRGQESEQSPALPSVSGPIEDLCLVWGLDGGHCNPIQGLNDQWDAADELSTYFTPNTTSPGNGAYQLFWDMEYVEYIATNVFSVDNSYFSNYTYWIPDDIVTPCTDWLFNQYGPLEEGQDEPCLCEDEMNCEWFNITEHIVSETGALHYSPNFHSPYYCCVVKDYFLLYPDPKVFCDRYHTARVCYAHYTWMNPNID